MFNQKHDIADEFPEHKVAIQSLKQNDNHFAKLIEEYHTLAGELHKIDEETQTPSDQYTEQKKKQRLALKDQLLAMITKAA